MYNWSEHINHIILFGFFGILIAGYYYKTEVQSLLTSKKRLNLPTSFTTLIFSMLLLFVSTHIMPCHYLPTNQTAQTAINHPCSQPTTPCTPSVSFLSTVTKIDQLQIANPITHFLAPIQNPDNNSPPST